MERERRERAKEAVGGGLAALIARISETPPPEVTPGGDGWAAVTEREVKADPGQVVKWLRQHGSLLLVNELDCIEGTLTESEAGEIEFSHWQKNRWTLPPLYEEAVFASLEEFTPSTEEEMVSEASRDWYGENEEVAY